MAKIAFLGLGVMGFPMAGHIAWLADVTVYNRTSAKARPGPPNGGASGDPAAAATGADFVFVALVMIPMCWRLRLAMRGIPAMKSGAVFIDNSTVSADVARKLYAAGQGYGVMTLDAPYPGGRLVPNGKLTVMVGGDDAAFDTALPVMQCYGAGWLIWGPPDKANRPRWSIKSV